MRASVRIAGSVVVVVAGLLLAGGLWGRVAPSHADGAGMALTPPSQVVHVGENVTVDIAVSGVTDLAAWEVMIKYDPAVLTFQAVQETTWMDSSGRTQNCTSPIVNSQSFAPKQAVQFGCGSFNATPAGVDGSAVVAHASFTANATGTTDLEVLKAELANPDGDDCCGAVSVGEGAVKVTEQGTDNGGQPLPPTPTPNPVKLTPSPVATQEGGPLTLPTQVPGSGSSSGSGSTPGTGTLGVARGGSSGSGGTLGASGSGTSAGGTGAPHAGDGTVTTQHSMLVRSAMALLALAGASCFAAVGLARRRAVRAGRREP